MLNLKTLLLLAWLAPSLIFIPMAAAQHGSSGSFATLKNQSLMLNSGVDKNILLELYTSEGCSSCPPADRWLSSLSQSDKLWSEIIPIAFHVDYWDYIGWKDPFADEQHSQRQRRYAREYGENTVYTPGIRVNGQPWLSWRTSDLDAADLPNEQVGELAVEVEGGAFNALFTPVEISKSDDNAKSFVLNLAMVGMGLQTQVSRGENRGRLLQHDFIVLAHQHYASKDGALNWSGSLPRPSHQASQYALIAWVSNDKSLMPIQSVGSYFPDSYLPDPYIVGSD